jgi:GAF domain-containing protein
MCAFLYDEEQDCGAGSRRVSPSGCRPLDCQRQGLQAGWAATSGLVNARPAPIRGGRRHETSLQSALVCPLVFDGNPIGTLAVYHSDPGRFTDDRRLLDRSRNSHDVNNSMVFEQTSATR